MDFLTFLLHYWFFVLFYNALRICSFENTFSVTSTSPILLLFQSELPSFFSTTIICPNFYFHRCQHIVYCPFDSNSSLTETNQIIYFPKLEKILHWLPVTFRTNSKVFIISYMTLPELPFS